VDSGELEHLSRERFWAEIEKTFKQTKRIDRFFSALDIFGVLQKVSFFKDLLGDRTWASLDFRAAIAFHLRELEPEIALPIFVAITASSDVKQASQVIPARVKKLTLNMRAVRKMDHKQKASSILGLLKANRAFTKGGEVGVLDLISAVHVADMVGEKLPVTAMELQIALNYASAVTGVNYQHLNGPEIGKAMDQARLEAIELTLR
jgi:tRNA nucleotidyltransferase/poly(A) polymerase